MIPLRIAPEPGYSPTIGRLVSFLTYVREGMLAAVKGLTPAQLDHLHDAESNTIGALLAHVAAVERWYQVFTFEAPQNSGREKVDAFHSLKIHQKWPFHFGPCFFPIR